MFFFSISSLRLSTTSCNALAASSGVSVAESTASTVSDTALSTVSSTGFSSAISIGTSVSSASATSSTASVTSSSTLVVLRASAKIPLSLSQKESVISTDSALIFFCTAISLFSFRFILFNFNSSSETNASTEKPFIFPSLMSSHTSTLFTLAPTNHVPIGQSNPKSLLLSFSVVFNQLSTMYTSLTGYWCCAVNEVMLSPCLM